MHFRTQSELKDAAHKAQKRMADLGHNVPLQILLEGFSHAAFNTTWNVVCGRLPRGKSTKDESVETAEAASSEEEAIAEDEAMMWGQAIFDQFSAAIAAGFADAGVEVRATEEREGRIVWHRLSQKHDAPIAELSYAGGAEGRIDVDLYDRPAPVPLPYRNHANPTYSMRGVANGNGEFIFGDLRRQVQKCFSIPPERDVARGYQGKSELGRLLTEALESGFSLLTLTDDGSPARKPIQGRGADNLNHPIDGGNHFAAFAELGISIPFNDSDGAGWVVLDGRRIEYQAAQVHRHDVPRGIGWTVVFHLRKPSPHPASKYRPDVIL